SPVPGSRRVQRDDGEFVVDVELVELGADDLPVFAERPKESPDGPPGAGDVVIARHDDEGRGKLGEESAGLFELCDGGPLGEIAADGDEAWPHAVEVFEQRIDDRGVDAVEVEVGDVRDGPQDAGDYADQGGAPRGAGWGGGGGG